MGIILFATYDILVDLCRYRLYWVKPFLVKNREYQVSTLNSDDFLGWCSPSHQWPVGLLCLHLYLFLYFLFFLKQVVYLIINTGADLD